MVSLFGLKDTPDIQTPDSEDELFSRDDALSYPYESSELGQLTLDVLENHEALYILAPVAGIALSDIDISVNDTTLTISGLRNKPKEFFEHGIKVKNEECFWGRFQRKIILPDNLDFSQIKAVMEYNLLVIHIPKIRFTGQKVQILSSHS